MRHFFKSLSVTCLPALFALTLAMAAPAPASAQTIDAAGAEALKKTVDDALSYYIQSQKTQGEGMSTGGDVVVTPKTDYYEVRIPDVKLGSDAGILNVGTVMLNVTPEADGDYRASVAVPQQMVMKDKDNVQRMTITLGQQKFSGVWRPALALFTQAAAEYRDVVITMTPPGGPDDGTGPVTMTLGAVKSEIAMKPDGAVWSGPQSTSVSNVAFAFGENNANRIAVDQVNFLADYKKLDLSVAKKFRDSLTAEMAANGQKLSPEAVRDVIRGSFGGLQSLPESVDTRASFTNFKMDLAARAATPETETRVAQPARGPINLQVSSASTESQLIGLKNDAGTGTAKWKLNGLSVNGLSGPMSGTIPNEVLVDFTLGNVPFKSGMEAITAAVENALTAQGTAQSAAEAKAQSSLYIQQALATLPKLMAKAGTTLVMRDTYSKAPDLSTRLEGQLKAVETSPFVFAGTMNLTLSGMDELIVKLQELSSTSNNPKAAGWAQVLILMQLSGTADKTPEGQSRRTYAIELMPEGGVRVNGADVSALLPRGAPSTPAVPAAPVPDAPSETLGTP